MKNSNHQAIKTPWLVVGLGVSGYSCVKYLARTGESFTVIDSRTNPPLLERLKVEFPAVDYLVGVDLYSDALDVDSVETLVMSPGISVDNTLANQIKRNGGSVIGDIDLFRREISAPLVAITGSNAKTTVTTLVGEMAKQAGLAVGVGGNIGTPVLDLLEQEPKQLYVLELSSFQLEIIHNLNATAVTLLNLSDDHMDRYDSFDDYKKAKQRIFAGCKAMVVNREAAGLVPTDNTNDNTISFGLDKPGKNQFGVVEANGERFIAFEDKELLDINELLIAGEHNVLNAMAAMALGMLVDIPMDKMISCLKTFPGLAHRCESVAEIDSVGFYNDSKATNVGACIAALEGLGKNLKGNILLIAGGDGKGSDFSPLNAPVKQFVSVVFLFGQDAQKLKQTLAGSTDIKMVSNLAEAVQCAWKHAKPGDRIILSPACASLDMFENYQQRGDQFKQLVRELEQAA